MNQNQGWEPNYQFGVAVERADNESQEPAAACQGPKLVEQASRSQGTVGGAASCREPADDAQEQPQPHTGTEDAAGVVNERALVAAAKNGDTVAFGELIERHRKECLKRAMLMIRNRSDAEDEVQNAFWKAFQRLDQFRGEGPFAAWLGRILENQCLMRIREARNSRFVYLDEANEANVRIELVGQTADPEEQVGTEEVIGLLRREVSRIPPLLRNAMLLRDLDQMPMPDVAAQLQVSVPAAKSRLMRARLELRSRVIKHCGKKGPGTLIQMTRHPPSAYTRAS